MVSNQNGTSLIEVLVMSAVFTVMAAGTTSMINHQAHEVRFLQQKLEAVDLEARLQRMIADPAICGANLNSARSSTKGTLDLSAVTKENPFRAPIEFPSLTLGSDPANATGFVKTGEKLITGLKIGSIRLAGLYPKTPGGQDFVARLEVAFDSASMARPIKPAAVTLDVRTNGALSAATVIGCGQGGSGLQACKGGYPCELTCQMSTGTAILKLQHVSPTVIGYAGGAFPALVILFRADGTPINFTSCTNGISLAQLAQPI